LESALFAGQRPVPAPVRVALAVLARTLFALRVRAQITKIIRHRRRRAATTRRAAADGVRTAHWYYIIPLANPLQAFASEYKKKLNKHSKKLKIVR